MDFKSWARMLRSPIGRTSKYSPEWVVDSQGRRRPPANAQDALEGAAQEWERLFHTPSIPWQHPAFLSWSDKLGNQRGGLNFEHLANMLRTGGEEHVNPARGASYDGSHVAYSSRRTTVFHFQAGFCRGWAHALDGRPIALDRARDLYCRYFTLEECQPMDHFRHMADVNGSPYGIALRPHSFSDHSALLRLEPDQRENWIPEDALVEAWPVGF